MLFDKNYKKRIWSNILDSNTDSLPDAMRAFEDYMVRHEQVQRYLENLFTAMRVGSKMERISSGAEEEESAGEKVQELLEFTSLLYAPLQAPMTNPIVRTIQDMVQVAIADSRTELMDYNNPKVMGQMLVQETLKEISRRFVLTKSVVAGLSNSDGEGAGFDTLYNHLDNATQKYSRFLAQDIMSQGITTDFPITNNEMSSWIIPNYNEWKKEYYRASSLKKYDMLDKMPKEAWDKRRTYSMPIIGDWNVGKIELSEQAAIANREMWTTPGFAESVRD